jgi:hypothetical protein
LNPLLEDNLRGSQPSEDPLSETSTALEVQIVGVSKPAPTTPASFRLPLPPTPDEFEQPAVEEAGDNNAGRGPATTPVASKSPVRTERMMSQLFLGAETRSEVEYTPKVGNNPRANDGSTLSDPFLYSESKIMHRHSMSTPPAYLEDFANRTWVPGQHQDKQSRRFGVLRLILRQFMSETCNHQPLAVTRNPAVHS